MRQNVRIAFLGGVGEIGKNMTVIECGNDIIVIDAGICFPNVEMPGIDLVLPDITYLKENAHKIRGLILTHGHEDHIGGVPYFLKEIDAPVYGTKLTLTLTENKIREHKLQNVKLNCVKEGSSLRLGVFSIEFIKVSHSISGSVALAITTPAGVIFHTGDFKIDYTPVDGEVMDLKRIAEIGKRGVTLLMCDSTNVERDGYTMSEKTVGDTFEEIFAENPDKRLFIATFASNVHRLQQIFDTAKKYKRKVALSGRSMLNVVDAAKRIGELHIDDSILVDIEKIGKLFDRELVILCTGTQGEPTSALTRIAAGQLNKVEVGENDLIILSSSAIPGNEKMIYNVINQLYKRGARVIYQSLEKVHVSGHACKEELKLLHTLVKPKFFIPVHGEDRHLIIHKELAMKLGMQESNILIPSLGCQIEVGRALKLCGCVPSGTRLVDGSGIEDAESDVLRDRRRLAEDGVIVVSAAVGRDGMFSKPDVISKGLMLGEMNYTRELKRIATENLKKYDLKDGAERAECAKTIMRDMKNYLFKKTRSSPMIIPVIKMAEWDDRPDDFELEEPELRPQPTQAKRRNPKPRKAEEERNPREQNPKGAQEQGQKNRAPSKGRNGNRGSRPASQQKAVVIQSAETQRTAIFPQYLGKESELRKQFRKNENE